MPTRLLSQRINVSNSISKLSALEEVVFLHLIVSCDDYGRFYGHPDIVKGMLFSRREFTPKQIESALQRLETEGMIIRYESDGAIYLALTSWRKYQNPRAKSSKYPGPDDANSVQHEVEHENTCEQTQTDEIEAVDCTPIVFTLPLNKGEFGVTEHQIQKYRDLYPAVNVEQEIRGMIGWLDANPDKRKTKTGIKSFMTRWLSKAQNSGRGYKPQSGYQPNHDITDGTGNPFRRA